YSPSLLPPVRLAHLPASRPAVRESGALPGLSPGGDKTSAAEQCSGLVWIRTSCGTIGKLDGPRRRHGEEQTGCSRGCAIQCLSSGGKRRIIGNQIPHGEGKVPGPDHRWGVKALGTPCGGKPMAAAGWAPCRPVNVAQFDAWRGGGSDGPHLAGTARD